MLLSLFALHLLKNWYSSMEHLNNIETKKGGNIFPSKLLHFLP
jgi:hypothetical protein